MARLIQRPIPLAAIESRFRSNPVVMLLGPRQCGKTTLARAYARGRNATYFDLESPPDAQRLEQALITLEPLRGTVIIDEAQLRPELFPVLRVLADRKPVRARFLLLGSAAPELVQGGSESLAGRIALLSIGGFHLPEVGGAKLRSLWTRGGFPRSFLARSDAESELWRLDFIQTFLERDLRKFGVLVAPITLRRFWNMLAHYHGQICNTSEIGRSLGESHTTIRRHLDILCGAYVLRQLPPWFENLGKRQVKSPKVYLRDSGILHALLGIGSFRQLESHPKLGASWEGFAMEEVLNVTGDREAYFWATQAGAELDLLVFVAGKRWGFEFKNADAPRVTRSLQTARDDLKLDHAFVVHPGADSYPLNEWCETLAIRDVATRLQTLMKSKRRSP